MAPNSAAIAGTLRQIIYYHLDNAAHDNALFFAERLSAQDPRSSESAHLLSMCHLRRGDVRSAYEVSKATGSRGINLGCAWVFAQASLALEKHKDGITALEKARSLWGHKATLGRTSATARSAYPDAAAVLCLLGRLNRCLGDPKKAINHFEESLRLNPFMWDAFTALCDMGVSIRVPNIFKSTEPLVHAFDQETAFLEQKENMGCGDAAPPKRPGLRGASDPFSAAYHPDVAQTMEVDANEPASRISRRTVASNNGSSLDSSMETPMAQGQSDPHVSRGGGYPEPPLAPTRKTRATQQLPQPTDAGLTESRPKLMYRIGAKRNTRAAAAEKDHSSAEVSDTATPMTQTTTTTSTSQSSLLAGLRAERKRTVSGHPVPPPRSSQPEEPGAPHRRSARLNVFNKPAGLRSNASSTAMAATASSATRELKKARPPISKMLRPGAAASSVGRVVSGNRKPLEDAMMDVDHGEGSRAKETQPPPPPQQPQQGQPPSAAAAALMRQAEAETAKVEEALKWILDLVRRMGSGYFSLAQFQCADALASFGQLPKTQLDTAWVQAQMGRAHYEQAAYAEAEEHYGRVRVLAPTRLQDLEIYSTVLWHLKRETQLSYLAYELTDMAWYAPQTWCVVGNSCSLSKDPEHALKCFRRATSIDPKFAYAYTLQGHEHVANEEYEKALAAYRQAITADKRHYNAYYGIGRVHERLGNFDKAHAHFHAASIINPTNPVLLVWIGTVLQAQKAIGPALQFFTRAVELAPKVAQTRYKRARALLAVGQIELAHAELMKLKDLAPDDARVHFLLGKLYRNMNDRQLAVRHFSNALALDPKASPQIKLAVERMEEDVSMDESVL